MIIISLGLTFPAHKEPVNPSVSNLFTFPPHSLKNGDLVFRNGKGLVSEVFRKTSEKDKSFSHAGIIRMTARGPVVIHIIGNHEKATSDIKVESLADFCNSQSNYGYAVYRNAELEKKPWIITRYLDRLQSGPVRFDEQFDLASATKLYCTELIYNLLVEAGNTPIQISVLKGRSYVALDDLYLNPQTSLIFKQTYLPK